MSYLSDFPLFGIISIGMVVLGASLIVLWLIDRERKEKRIQEELWRKTKAMSVEEVDEDVVNIIADLEERGITAEDHSVIFWNAGSDGSMTVTYDGTLKIRRQKPT